MKFYQTEKPLCSAIAEDSVDSDWYELCNAADYILGGIKVYVNFFDFSFSNVL